jgi:hypothetical protein
MATGVKPLILSRRKPARGRRWLSAGTGFCALVTAVATIAPMPTASANMLYDPHVVMYTFMSSGVDYFVSESTDGMPAVARDVRSCYAVNDHPGWFGRFVTCNAEDDAAYLYSQYLLKTRGINPVPYFQETAFERRQNQVLEIYQMPQAQWSSWITAMRHRVWRLLVLKINGGLNVPPS